MATLEELLTIKVEQYGHRDGHYQPIKMSIVFHTSSGADRPIFINGGWAEALNHAAQIQLNQTRR